MSKAVYQEVSENIIDNFKVGARLSALTSNKKNGEIYSFDDVEFNRIVELLSPNQKFKKSSTKRKAFVLSDVKYTVVAAASILAKVTRDREIKKIKEKIGVDFGSGYTSDERTQKFLKENWEKYPSIFRKTWISYKKVVNDSKQRNLEEF